MRRRRFALAAALAAALAGRALAQAEAPNENPPPSGVLENPDRSGTSSVTNAAAAPLHDMNLVRQTIPPILMAALADPYARPRPTSCASIADQVEALDQALGPDFGEADNPQQPRLATQRGEALTLMHGAAEYFLPFSGFIRTLSGAQKHDQLVVEVITAGSVRRGYLKGLGEAHGCLPPATASHLANPAPPYQESRRPEYPIH